MISEKVLIDFKKGKKYAFDEIYSLYAGGMYGICLRYTRCEDDAKDVLQETFIKVFSNKHSYKMASPIGAWIKAIAINTALTYIKRTYKYVLYEDEAIFDELTWDQHETAKTDDMKTRLLAVLNKLPDGYRLVFNLFTIDNLTHKEIAEHLGVSESTSKTQYFKAKKFIQKILESEKMAE